MDFRILVIVLFAIFALALTEGARRLRHVLLQEQGKVESW